MTEHTPVYVVWSRGNKKAKTKSRLLNENVFMAVIDEKFQINTVMDVNEEGTPTKEKMVTIHKHIHSLSIVKAEHYGRQEYWAVRRSRVESKRLLGE